MSVELAAKIKELEGQLKTFKSQVEVLSAEIQEKTSHAIAYRTNLHITQKAFQELHNEKLALETKVKELEERLKPHEVKADEPVVDAA